MPVELEYQDAVAVLTIDEPGTKNALTGPIAADLLDRLAEVADRVSVGALVIRGGRGAFCSGGDRGLIERARQDIAADGIAAGFEAIYRVFDVLSEMPVPTIAAVRGAAVGAGVNLALAADIRIVAEDVRFLAGFLRIGVHPGGGHLLMSHRAGGRQATVAMSLLGAEPTGQRLKELGIAWECVPDDQVDEFALALARRAGDPELVRRTIATYREERSRADLTVAAAAQIEQSAQFWSFGRKAAG